MFWEPSSREGERGSEKQEPRMISIDRKTKNFPQPRPSKNNNNNNNKQNLAAWATAGVIAYVAWVRPEQQRAREREEAKVRARLEAAASAPSLRKGQQSGNDRASPTPDPQIGGLSVGNPKKE